MSFVDGNLGTWPKEKRSGPYGVSFDIPFDKEDCTGALPSTRGMVRSVSTDDGSGFKLQHLPRGMRRNLSFQPVNGRSVGIEEEGCPDSLAGMETVRRSFPNGHGSMMATTPSMEEALQIIHSPSRPPLEGINNGFFLHSQVGGQSVGGLEPLSELDSKGPPSTTDTEVDTGIHLHTEDMLDEDSSLKDCSVNMDLEMDTPSPCPSSVCKSPSGVKLTSFAEQKMKKHNPSTPDSGRYSSSSLKTTPEGSDFGLPLSVSWAPTPEHSPVHQQITPALTTKPSPTSVQLPPTDPAQVMATEMVQLRMRLEEKRKAIEAQKKKVEAAFTRHRQKMGHSAFLSVVKRKGDGAASGEEEGKPEAEGKAASTSPAVKFGRSKADTPDGAEQSGISSCWAKSPGVGEEGGQGPAQLTEVDLTEYTRSIEKLNHSLAFLQTEMQRLAQQQEVIMAMREQQHQQAWVIPAPHKNPSPQRYARAGGATRSSGPSSPADSPRSTHRSPTSIKRKSASFHSRNPRVTRPSELKLAPYNRVLTAPQSVDSIPRLRRFSPCQPLACSFVYMEEKKADAEPAIVASGGDKEKEAESPLSPDKALDNVCVATSLPRSPSLTNNKEENSQCRLDIHSQSINSNVQKDGQENLTVGDFKSTIETTVSEVLAHPVVETFTVTPTEIPSLPSEAPGQAKSSLIEVPLSVIKTLEDVTLCDGLERQQDSVEDSDYDQKLCRGFFFKDDGKAEENMAQKRAALLEKRMRREKETQQKKVQLEAELEQRKEEARLKAEEERIRKEEDKARKEFIKQEYLRRKQLKLMEDMDTVIKPRAASGAKQKRGRPKSIHRDSMDSPKTPIRAATVCSLSLASLNLGDGDSVHSDKRSPRPDSADGFLSPSCSSSRNGEKDWENGSTTSSVTSNTEYTGPKLYKEPSAKSNKHIIQNALAHCCLAGKVNEGQKNKILEEMEKSEANNFLVLFRDAGCQFRSLYTYCPETEDINKLAGIGPKSITRKMIDGLYKYNSDKKQFSQIPAKTMSASVDAVTIHNHLWQTKKPATPKKVVPAQT